LLISFFRIKYVSPPKNLNPHLESHLEVISLTVNLLIDGEKIELNDFVEKFFTSTLEGAVSSLRDINKDWKKLELVIERS